MCNFSTPLPQLYISLILKGKAFPDAKTAMLCMLFSVGNVLGFVRHLLVCNNIVTAILNSRPGIQELQ